MIMPISRNFDVYLHTKKSTSSLTSFLRYCKDITNSLFWELWECLIMHITNHNITLQETLMPKVLISTRRKLWCLSASKKSTSSLTSFLRYCEDITNLLFLRTLEMLGHPHQNHSINLQQAFMLICMQKINFIIHFS